MARAGSIPGGVPRRLAQKSITVDEVFPDYYPDLGVPKIVPVDDPFPQQRFRYVAAITAAAVVVAEVFNPSPSDAARAAVISAAWAPANPTPQQPDTRIAAFTAAPVAEAAFNPVRPLVISSAWLPANPAPQQPDTRIAAFTASPAAATTDNPPGLGIPRIVSQPDDPLPQVNRKLPQGQIAAAVADYVPFVRHLEVLGAWAPIQFSLPAQVKIAALYPNQDAVPQLPRHLETVLAAWAAPPPAIVLPAKDAAITPPSVVAADVPLLPRHLEATLAAWAAPPAAIVLPVKGAATIPAAVVAVGDNPPPLRRNQDWTPWDVTVPVKLVVSCAATDGAAPAPPAVNDNPPFGLRRLTSWAWGPLDFYPGGGGQFVPQDEESHDTAPTSREWLDIVVRAWKPADPLPTLPRKFTQAQVQVAPTSDNPPFTQRQTQDWVHFYPAPPLPTLPDKLVQGQVAAQGDNPPFGRRFLRPDGFDTLPYPNPTLGRVKLPQGQVAAVTDDPPFNQRRTQDWTSFYPAPPLPTLRAKLFQDGTPDNPPFTQRQTQDWAHFYPAPPLPKLTVKLPQGQVAATSDNPPFTSRHVQNWTPFYPPPPLPTLRVKLPQGQVPATSDNPPFTSRRRQDWSHWYDTVPVKLVVSRAVTEEVPPPAPVPTPTPTPGGGGPGFSYQRYERLLEELYRKKKKSPPKAKKALAKAIVVVKAIPIDTRAEDLARLLQMLDAAAAAQNAIATINAANAAAEQARALLEQQRLQRLREEDDLILLMLDEED